MQVLVEILLDEVVGVHIESARAEIHQNHRDQHISVVLDVALDAIQLLDVFLSWHVNDR